MKNILRIAIFVFMSAVFIGQAALADNEMIRYDLEHFYQGTRGFIDLAIDVEEKTCEGGMIHFIDEKGNKTEWDTEFGTCLVWKDVYDDNKLTALAIQFTLRDLDKFVFYGWVSVNEPELEKRVIAGYWVRRGQTQSYPWIAVATPGKD